MAAQSDPDTGQETVGVVVPMFNAQRTITATLRSICEQTHRNLDIVVVDDGSADGSAAIVAAWCERDSRIRLLRQANAGVAAARNAGAAAATAQFLAFIDADDLWAPTKIAFQLGEMQSGGAAVGLVYCWYASIGQDDRVTTFGPQPLDEGFILKRLCASNLIGNGSTLLMRRSVFEAVGGFDPSLRASGLDAAEDYQICLRIAELAEFRVVPRYLVGYRSVPGSMSSYSLRMFLATKMALLEYRERYPDYAGVIDKQLQDFGHWFAWGAMRQGRWGDAARLVAECVTKRPVAAPLRFALMAFMTLKGRLLRRLGVKQPFLPVYTNTVW
jgi:glycosyltransferase involved in cell wall biosynthesis